MAGLKIHGLPVSVFLCVFVGLCCGLVFPSQNICKVTKNKQHPQHKKRLQRLFFLSYPDMKTK